MTDTEIQKHFVTFYSPGTFTAETSAREISGWDIDEAILMARRIKERHGATPYGFRFSTRGRTAQELDSHELSKSCMYYLGGKVETREEVEARNDPKEDILRSNMKCNGWNRILVNNNSWKWTHPLQDGDIILEF
jgi:hypothetical protein